MNAKIIRCDNDLKLYQKLLETPEVKRIKEQLDRHEEKGPMGTRRHLLSTSVRLSAQMASGLHRMVDQCVEKLGLQIPVELYAYSSPQFNAACFKPEEGRLFIMFSSSLLEAFAEKELLFVVGHELGHHVYRHHDVPIGYILQGKDRPSASLALELFAWSRYAEISADRAGAFCSGDLDSIARALFKLASGLTSSNVVQFSLDDFLRQLDDMMAADAEPGQGAPMQDWFSTHPFSPLRVKALKLFDDCGMLRSGQQAKTDLEIKVQAIMSLMEPNYIEARTDTAETMRRLLFAGAVLVADAQAGISQEEMKVLKRFFGEAFDVDNLNIDKIKRELPNRIDATRAQASMTQRMQVLRDLCIVAKAEGDTSAKELEVIKEIARGLKVPCGFVYQCVEEKLELD
ncbi:MAG: M48 family metallopeptidase [Pseudomonadales bacterium]